MKTKRERVAQAGFQLKGELLLQICCRCSNG
jgi:hypothetical protein